MALAGARAGRGRRRRRRDIVVRAHGDLLDPARPAETMRFLLIPGVW
jgi:hypothetical protein